MLIKTNSKELYPDPSLEVLLAWLDANYEVDQAAVAYFNDWRNQCGHDHATDAHVKEYVTNASVLNACINVQQRQGDTEDDGPEV